MRTSNQGKNPKQERAGSKGKTPVQRDHQEVQHIEGESDLKTRKCKLQEELQGYMYSQSSKLSSVSRNLIFGIIGTIWVMTYSEGKLAIPNPQLFYALLISLLFMATDVLHYLMDSVSYHRQQYKLDSYKTQKELSDIYEREMDRINKRSHNFVIGKIVVLFIASIMFIWGIMKYIPSICEVICGEMN